MIKLYVTITNLATGEATFERNNEDDADTNGNVWVMKKKYKDGVTIRIDRDDGENWEFESPWFKADAYANGPAPPANEFTVLGKTSATRIWVHDANTVFEQYKYTLHIKDNANIDPLITNRGA